MKNSEKLLKFWNTPKPDEVFNMGMLGQVIDETVYDKIIEHFSKNMSDIFPATGGRITMLSSPSTPKNFFINKWNEENEKL